MMRDYILQIQQRENLNHDEIAVVMDNVPPEIARETAVTISRGIWPSLGLEPQSVSTKRLPDISAAIAIAAAICGLSRGTRFTSPTKPTVPPGEITM